MRNILTQFAHNKKIDFSLLSFDQIEAREGKNKIAGSKKQCNKCQIFQSINEFYVVSKKSGVIIRKKCCRDCIMKRAGVLNIGAFRFSKELLSKNFRRCSICKDIKPLNEYAKYANNFGGHSNNCKSCAYELNGIRREKERKQRPPKEKKIFFDDLYFLRNADVFKYIEKKYGVPFTASQKRHENGKSFDECKISKHDTKSIAYSKGRIRVTDCVTNEEFVFINTRDEKLRKLFSTSAISLALKTGKRTTTTSLSKYKNPCFIVRISK